MPDEITKAKSYLGHDIKLDSNWEFIVSGPEFGESEYTIRFPSLYDAKEEIKSRVNEAEKFRAKNIIFKAVVLNSDGNKVEITNIDRRNGEISDQSDGRDVYPNIPWVAQSIARLKSLYNEIRNTNEQLNKIAIKKRRSLGRIDPDEYLDLITQLGTEIKEKAQKAREMAQPNLEADNDSKTA